MKKALCALVLAATATPALGGSPWYLGLGLSAVKYDTERTVSGIGSFEVDAEPMALQLMGGYEINNWLAVEGRLGASTEDELEINGIGTDVNARLDAFVSVFARATVPIDFPVKPYGLLGATYGHASVDLRGVDDENESDISYGLGLQFGDNEGMRGILEVVRYLDKDDTTIDAVTFFLVENF